MPRSPSGAEAQAKGFRPQPPVQRDAGIGAPLEAAQVLVCRRGGGAMTDEEIIEIKRTLDALDADAGNEALEAALKRKLECVAGASVEERIRLWLVACRRPGRDDQKERVR